MRCRRDLVGNWNVDIAGELGDYLNDLDEITFTFDGGSTNLNFAEAALLIQGGALNEHLLPSVRSGSGA